MGSGAAHAQTPPPAAADKGEQLETVVVTGIRSSLTRASTAKRDATQFVDAVFAEDIGKLPDTNVAESLARISGVQLSQGVGGEGTSITIRGSRDNVVLLNGRQIIDVAGRGGQGQDTLGTSSYGILSIIPSELIQGLKVTKLPGADEIEGGLGGTVNIQTHRPLDLKKSVIAGSVEGGLRKFGRTDNVRTSLLYSDLSADRRFGALANIVYSKGEVREDNFSSFTGYQSLPASFNTGNTTGVKSDPNGDGVAGSKIADLRYQSLREERERMGLSTTLQWRPVQAMDLFADLSYMKTKVDRSRNWLGVPLSNAGADWKAVTMSSDEYIVGGTETTRLTASYERMLLDTSLFASAIGGSWQGDGFKVSGEIDVSRSRGQMNQWAGVLTTVDRYDVSFDYAGGTIPSVNIPTIDLKNPATFIWTNNQDNRRPSSSGDKAARLDLEHDLDLGWLTSMQVGARVNETTYDFRPSNNSVSSTPGVNAGFNAPASQTGSLVSLFSVPNFVNGANVPREFMTANANLATNGCRSFDAFYSEAQKLLCAPTVETPLAVSSVTEQMNAAYVKANFETRALGGRLEGNFGARYVQTDLKSSGFTRYSKNGVNTFTSNEVSNKRNDFLPSVVAKLSLPDGLVFRAGAAQVIARPATSLLNSSFTISESTNSAGQTVYSASGGNPNLKPYEVSQIDLAAEFYHGKTNFAAVNLFYKDVNTYFVTQTLPEIVDGVNGNQPINVTRTTNAFGAKIKGIELVVQQDFGFVSPALKNFGAMVSYSRIASETPTIDPTTKLTLPLPGLAKSNGNFVLYYETSDYGVRAALTQRGSFFDSIGANQAGIYYDKYSSLAISGWANLTKNVKLTLSGSNLADEPVRIYAGKPQYLKQLSFGGAIYALNLSAKF